MIEGPRSARRVYSPREKLGVPQVRTDNGPAFKSAEFRRFLAGQGIVARRSRPHCPEDNGVIERGIRTLKELAGEAGIGPAWSRSRGQAEGRV
ncbi:MAG: hypothetical protein R6X12_00115 [bacterium]